MNTNETKNKLHKLIDESDDELTNILMETAEAYKTNADIEIPQEWIDEAMQRSADLRSGKDKGITLEESLKQIDDILKHRRSV